MEGAIKYNVSADTSQFDAGMSRVKNSAGTAASGVSSAFKGVAAALGGTMMLSGLKTLMDGFDRIGKLATRFNTSVESIQRIGVAADLAGTDIEAVANAMTKAGIAASQAATTGGQMAEKFKLAGVNAREFANADIDKRLLMIAEAYAAAGGNADKTNAIIELMGSRAGANLIPLISNVEALREEMEGASVASEDTIRTIEEANDNLTRIGNTLKVSVAEGLQAYVELFEKWGSFFGGRGFKTIKELDQELEQMGKKGKAAGKEAADAIDPLVVAMKAAQDETRKAAAVIEGDFNRKLLPTAKQIAIVQEKLEELYQAFTGDKETDKGIAQEILSLEKERLSLLEKQKKEAELFNETRNQARQTMELQEAELSGDPAKVRDVRQHQRARALQEKGYTIEEAAAIAANEAELDRRAAMEDAPPTYNERVAEMLGAARGKKDLERAQELAQGGAFGSAVRRQDRAQAKMDRAMRDARMKDSLAEQGYKGASAMQDAYKDYLRDTSISPKRMSREEFERSMREQAKSPEQKAREEEKASRKGVAGAKTAEDPVASTVQKILTEITNRLPIVALN